MTRVVESGYSAFDVFAESVRQGASPLFFATEAFMTRYVSLLLLIAAVMPACGCVYQGKNTLIRCWADKNTLRTPALFMEKYNHLPYRKQDVDYYRWMYNAGPGPVPAVAPMSPQVFLAEGDIPFESEEFPPHVMMEGSTGGQSPWRISPEMNSTDDVQKNIDSPLEDDNLNKRSESVKQPQIKSPSLPKNTELPPLPEANRASPMTVRGAWLFRNDVHH
ncbi:hypothetical protein [Calycomorphotria hydatis]|uniref:Uncharacterized protein n=1 Tax=Calycomorphotria hydatis TaxID=2528027 RepID=A0A517T374_9PLAN|nr:hypothetical protein [Calycomorphotria hydatis]QDT62816.1 hypothetical protein V22_00140 [Calycomorphotria hydatis]